MLFRPLFAQREHTGVLKSLTLRRVTRAVWHLPSVSWLLMAAMSWIIVGQTPFSPIPVYFACLVYLLSAVGNCIATRGRHFGWLVLAGAACSLWAAMP